MYRKELVVWKVPPIGIIKHIKIKYLPTYLIHKEEDYNKDRIIGLWMSVGKERW